MSKVKNIKVISYAKVQAIMMAFAGLVAGFLYSGIGLIYDASIDSISYGTALAFLAIPIMPIYFAVFGFVTGLIGAYLFNIFSKWFGGIEINLVDKE